jgi:hypothetical protein
VIESELTRVDEEPEPSGESAWRRAMRRFSSGRNTHDAPPE